MKRKIHIVGGQLADGSAATFVLCERAAHREAIVEVIGLDPFASAKSSAVVKLSADLARDRVMRDRDWAVCTRCKRGEKCSVVSGELDQLSGVPFLFLVETPEGPQVGGDHYAFNKERTKRGLSTLGSRVREFFAMAATVEQAIDTPSSDLNQMIGGARDAMRFVNRLIGSQPMAAFTDDAERAAAAELGLRWPCTEDELRAAWKREAHARHSDHGGSDAAFLRATNARKTLERALGLA